MAAEGEEEPHRLVKALKDGLRALAPPPGDHIADVQEDLMDMAQLLALGPRDPDVQRRVLGERDPRIVELTSRLCEAEKTLREVLGRLVHAHDFTPAMLMMLFGQILAGMATDDPIMAQGWRRYFLAITRKGSRMNRTLVRLLGYGILARERAQHCGAKLTDGIGPPVSASERRSI